MTEFDHKPWSPWFNHFEIELTLVAGNDVKFVTVVQPTLLLWSRWFQDGGVSNFAGSYIFYFLTPQKIWITQQKNYPNNPKKKPMHYCSYREQKKLPFRVPLMITRMLTKRTIRMRAAMEVRFNSQTLFTLKWRRLRRIKCGIGRFHVDFLVAETFMN